MVKEILKTEDENDENDDGRHTEGELLSSVLLDLHCELLFDIHAHLIYNNEQKWVNKTLADFYPCLLTSGEALMSECTVAELKTICGVIEHHTKRSWFKSGTLKSVIVNTIVRAFGGTATVPEESIRKVHRPNVFSAEKLSTLAHNYLKRGTYERIRLTVALGTVMIPYEHKKWLQ